MRNSDGSGILVLAATPIGNIRDASSRLVDLLKNADIVAAEDTRRLYDLAHRLNIEVSGTVISYYDHNEHTKAAWLCDEVKNGKTVCVVSDAGMPTINDPGLTLVREAIKRDIPITCAPGPSAALDALAISGLPTDRFCYEGFIPRKKGEKKQYFSTLLNETRTMIFYESPQRIEETLEVMVEIFPADRSAVLARELTKNYEDVRRLQLGDLLISVQQDHPRGELVLLLHGASTKEVQEAQISDEDYRVYTLLGDGEIQEGQVWEAAMLAGFRKLDNLVVIVDNNNLQIDGTITEVNSPYPIDQKFEAFNFHVITIDGNDFDQIAAAFAEARTVKGQPTAIVAKTVKGKGVSFMENQVGWHGSAPNDEQYAEAMKELEEAGEALCQM